MSPNQRLLVAVLLSVLFFVAYTAIFPAEKPELAKTDTQNIESAQKSQTSNQPQISKMEEETVVNDLNTLVTVNNSKFIIKLDTLGRISSKVLLQDKYNNKENQHAELIPATGTKPLFVRFFDSILNDEATKVAYTADVSEISIEDKSQKVILTQKLSNLTITKEVTFYPDGHYDAKVSLSDEKRHFIYF